MWARAARPDATRALLQRRGTHVWIDGDGDTPIREAIPGRPPVLFGEGAAPDAFAAPRVAIVGTRSATPHGLADARELGGFLAAAGITVVSGLAIGIDGAAHEGALAGGGRAVGVVATGLDVTYPRRHRALYAGVREHGVVVSEHAYGIQPHAAQFPVRNRIIAALCDVCVVVEATVTRRRDDHGPVRERLRPRGVRAARRAPQPRRGRLQRADQGRRADPARPGRHPHRTGPGPRRSAVATGARAAVDADETAALDALGGEPATIDQLVGRTGLSPGRLAGVLRRLEQAGHIEKGRGRWWPR